MIQGPIYTFLERGGKESHGPARVGWGASKGAWFPFLPSAPWHKQRTMCAGSGWGSGQSVPVSKSSAIGETNKATAPLIFNPGDIFNIYLGLPVPTLGWEIPWFGASPMLQGYEKGGWQQGTHLCGRITPHGKKQEIKTTCFLIRKWCRHVGDIEGWHSVFWAN